MRARVFAHGIVQGVGFRPFVYRTAKKRRLKGLVRNAGNGAEIVVEGEEGEIKSFLLALEREAPPLSRIEGIEVRYIEGEEYEDFQIVESVISGDAESVIPPDVCICERCLEEVWKSDNRRHNYPFTVCVDCGARFTIIKDVPYDRKNTTMRPFSMCEDCREEYEDPLNRRHHAEPICCPTCGPAYSLFLGTKKREVEDPIGETASLLERDNIVAIMGVGGTHVAARLEDDMILKLRSRIGRAQKPFAIMVRDIKTARRFAGVGKKEEELLTSLRRPIVVLQKKKGIPKEIAPLLENVGIMLPYTAVHHILFSHTKEPGFIMTSANIPGEPMLKSPDAVIASGIADASLVHDRVIGNRADDSVIRVVNGSLAFVRRSRGYAPEPIDLAIEGGRNILALGAELNVAACLLKGKRAFVSQYIGNTTKVKTLDFLKESIDNLHRLTRVKDMDAVAVDMHPQFATTRLGEQYSNEFGTELFRIQHHEAHVASLAAERHLDEVVGIATDGVGYGSDGSIWGGEIITARGGDFARLGSLETQLMPGGDLATRYPARMLAGMLYGSMDGEELRALLTEHAAAGFRREDEIDVVLKQLETNFNVARTTSTGRILDATAALLGLCYERTYEGEPAMKLEALAARGSPKVELPVVIAEKDGRYVLETTGILLAAIEARKDHRREDIASSVQHAIATGFAEIAVRCAEEEGISKIGITGGVAYNEAIVSQVARVVKKSGFELLQQEKAPPGDGGIALGQALIASYAL